MNSKTKPLTAAAAALAIIAAGAVDAAGEGARSPRPTRQVKAWHIKNRVAHRLVAPRTVPVSAAAYAGRVWTAPYRGPGRAYFEPVPAGAAPERADEHSPEGP